MAISFIGKFPFITTKKTRIVPFDFYNNMFSTFGTPQIDWTKFIDDSQQNYEELLRAYNTLSEVSSPINFWAENSSKVKFKVFEEKGDELEEVINPDDSLVKLLNNPNQYLGWNELKANNLIYFKLFGNSYLNFLGKKVGEGTPTALYLIPPQNTVIKLKGISDLKSSIDFRDFEIDNYGFILSDNPKRIKPIDKEQILHLRSANPNYLNGSFLYGQSPIVSAQYAINSIYSGYSAKVGLYKNGPKTIFSLNPPSGNEFGSFELPDGAAVEAEQKRLGKYGIEEGQWQNIISKLPLNASRLSYNIGELQINENNIRDFQTVCAAIGIDSRLLGDPSSSTFANQEEASKKFYQGSFVSGENAFFHDLTTKIRTYEKWANRVIQPDFSEIPELGEAEKDIQDLLSPDLEKGLITRSEYLKSRGMSTEELPAEYSEYYTYSSGIWKPVNNLNTIQDENIQEF